MSGVWTYGRRPSGVVRYRHGGYNALYPLAAGEVFDGVAATQRLAKHDMDAGTADASAQPRNAEPEKLGANILLFSGAGQRRRSHDPGRTGPRQSGSPPPKTRE